jgi:hypothetical protein
LVGFVPSTEVAEFHSIRKDAWLNELISALKSAPGEYRRYVADRVILI